MRIILFQRTINWGFVKFNNLQSKNQADQNLNLVLFEHRTHSPFPSVTISQTPKPGKEGAEWRPSKDNCAEVISTSESTQAQMTEVTWHSGQRDGKR